MKWKHCSYCPLDGTCENQDRGHECEMPIKKLLEENAKLKGLLKECQEIIEWYKADCGYKDLPTESVLTKIEEGIK